MKSLPPVLREHLQECAECDADAQSFERLASLLDSETASIDPSRLTQQAMPLLSAALDSNAADALWRRVVTALVFAIAPLPLILAWDTYLLRAFHDLLQSFMPTPVATYVTFSYAALLTLLLAGTYAVIPISFGRRRFERAWRGLEA